MNTLIPSISIKKIIIYTIIFVLYFLYFYSPKLPFIPIIPRIIYFCVGLSLFFIFLLSNSKIYWFNVVKKDLGLCVILLIVLNFISLVSCCLNHCIDFDWFKMLFFIVFNYVAFLPIFLVMHRLDIKISFESISDFIILINTAQIIIALILFFQPDLRDNVLLYIYEENVLKSQCYRLIGLGYGFFSAGVTNAVVMQLISLQILSYGKTYITKDRLIIYFVALFINGIIGLGVARTTFIGWFGVLIMFALEHNKKLLSFLKRNLLKYFALLALIVLCLFSIFPSENKDRVINLSVYAFQIFYNLIENGEFSTSSTSGTLKMVHFPDDNQIKTWLFGDAKFLNNDGSYYKHTDVGYCRIIYGYGISGLISYFSIFLLFIYITKLKCKYQNVGYYFEVLIVLFLIWNFKGLNDVSLYICPFLYGRITTGNSEYFCAAEQPVQSGESHHSRPLEPLA